MYQLLIRGGLVCDPACCLYDVMDIAVADGKIADVGRFEKAKAEREIDATGCLVTPGLIDHHAHLYPLTNIGIPAEAVCFSSGVTTVVDAGSTGCKNFTSSLPLVKTTKLTVKAYLNVCSTGLASLPKTMENVMPENYEEGAIRETFEEYGDCLLGLKLRTSREIVAEQGYKPLRETVKLAEKLGVPVMVHCTNPPGSMGELLGYLRKGDILTHMYMNKGSTILNKEGKVRKEAWEARARGVLFEAADARAHFSFEVSQSAMGEAFYPDFIATDLTKFSMYLRPTAFNLDHQLSKYMALGLPIDQLIACCTSQPARHMGMEGKIGCLRPGAEGDIAVFRLVSGPAEFGDRPYGDLTGRIYMGEQQFKPLLTVKRGEIVYRDVLF